MERSSGILLHPTSLPGRFGTGDLGEGARRFLDWLEAAGQGVWQVLPLGPTGHGNSPYGTLSAFAGNPLLISPQRLVDDGLLASEAVDQSPEFEPGRVDYERLAEWKESVLRTSWETFQSGRSGEDERSFDAFIGSPEQRPWLDDWCLYAALKEELNGQPWSRWPKELRLRKPAALEQKRQYLEPEIAYQRYQQYLFWRQWSDLKTDANERGIRIFGDTPIYLALDSAEVWAHRELFALDDEGKPSKVSGVPPDYFSDTGQLWGNPIYRWDRLAALGYRWWIERLRNDLERVDLLRLDHFRGFAGFWQVDAEETTAVNGEWVDGPGLKLFEALSRALGELPLVAEDLGVITPDVEQLRKDLRIPGMKVLQFGFFEIDSEHLPHNVGEDTVYYTGTHDNDTSVGWFARLEDPVAADTRDYLGTDGVAIHWDLIRAVLRSRARLTIVPVQDVLGLDSGARMNTPGVGSGNWEWRLTEGQLDESLAEWMRRLCLLTGRWRAAPSKGDEDTEPLDEADSESADL